MKRTSRIIKKWIWILMWINKKNSQNLDRKNKVTGRRCRTHFLIIKHYIQPRDKNWLERIDCYNVFFSFLSSYLRLLFDRNHSTGGAAAVVSTWLMSYYKKNAENNFKRTEHHCVWTRHLRLFSFFFFLFTVSIFMFCLFFHSCNRSYSSSSLCGAVYAQGCVLWAFHYS